MTSMNPNTFLFSFDGGGFRGYLSALIISRIHGYHITHRSDFRYAGTSTGSLIASLLALGFHPSKISQLYADHMKQVFKRSFFSSIGDLFNITGSKYDHKYLKKLLQDVLGDKRLGDVPRPLLIVAFKLSSEKGWRPKIFTNTKKNDPDMNVLLRDAILCSISAPTYFPTYSNHIDGGVAANDPSMCQIAEALSCYPLNRVYQLSIGTGQRFKNIQGSPDWGFAQWAPHLIDLLMDANQTTASYQAKAILGDNYLRINPYLPRDIPLDDVKYKEELEKLAEQTDISAAVEFLSKYSCQALAS